MFIERINIKNFKCFKDQFSLDLSPGLNIIVGNNEAGKTTILEAIHLALSGYTNSRHIKNEVSEYLFNVEVVGEYKKQLSEKNYVNPPELLIELFFSGENLASFEGNGNTQKSNACGITFRIALDENYSNEYIEYIQTSQVFAVPIEYYEITWQTFARELITTKKIPIRSAMIDSSQSRTQNGSDLYISHIIKNHLEEKERNGLTQAHRKLQKGFMEERAVLEVNKIISEISKLKAKDRELNLSTDLATKNAWENHLLTYVENIPFQNIGKGEQSIIKTRMALAHKKTKEASILLFEEPESHLSHSRLNSLIREIEQKCSGKQILISTHSSFVANKLGLTNLILLQDRKHLKLLDLNSGTRNFFKKIPGYDTLRLILCKKAILVEGDSDELIVQRAYQDYNDGRLPIEDEIDVISVGTSFLRFLELGAIIGKEIAVVTDNDGSVENVIKKYEKFIDGNAHPNIKICFDEIEDHGQLIKDKVFNYNTLEPKLLKSNGISLTNQILGTSKNMTDLHSFMQANKTECALKFFEAKEKITFPNYIVKSFL